MTSPEDFSAGENVSVLPDGSPSQFDVSIEADRIYYLAMAHRSPVRSITVHNLNADDLGELVVTCRVESASGTPLLAPTAIGIPTPRPGLSTTVRRVRLAPNRRALALLEERLPADLVVTVTAGERIVAIERSPIEFLAGNQWMFADAYWDSLAAFVQPNSPAIDQVLRTARQLLDERTGSSSTEGYQSIGSDPERVHHMARALFDALRGMKIEYSNPPASFEGYGQKVRTPDVVLRERAATCLDSSVLFASGLARMGLKPYIVMVRGHALTAYQTGYSTDRDLDPALLAQLNEPTVPDPNGAAMLAAAGVIAPVETTAFTSAHDMPFEEAVELGGTRFGSEVTTLQGLINVAASVQHGVVPLPSVATTAVGEAGTDEQPLVVESWADQLIGDGERPTPVEVDDGSERARLDDGDIPPRIRSWLRSLLDLSFRNPLLRMPSGRSAGRAMVLDLPAGAAAAVEDQLMSGGTLRFLPATDMPSALRADPTATALYIEHIRSRGEVFSPGFREAAAYRRAVIEEITSSDPALPAGTVEQNAEALCADVFSKMLTKTLRSLKRKADDVERQTGANNLFLCIGTLAWTGDDGRDGQAPLFLIPVRLSGTPRTGYSLQTDDTAEVMPNHALLERVRLDYGISIDVLERPVLDDAGIDVDALLQGVRAALAGDRVKDAVVTDAVSLAVLDFSSFRLWRDLRDSWPVLMQSPVVNHLVNTPSQDYEDPATDDERPTELLCPLPADESQSEAIAAAVAGRTFVLEGPPGTGKSQTITNLLAASIAAGKKVLFVAEKSAALDVVRKRLTEVGLGSLCLELFDKEAKPDHIRDQIRASLDLLPPDPSAEWDALSTRLESEARRLEDYRAAIHAPGASGVSAWDARQDFLEFGDGPAFDIPAEALPALPHHRQAVLEALLDLPRVVGSDVIEPNPWALCADPAAASGDLAILAQVLQQMESARSVLAQQTPSLVDELERIADPAELSAAAAAIRNVARAAALTAADLQVIGLPDWVAQRDAALARGDAFAAGVAPYLQVFHPSVLTDDLGPVLAAGNDAITAGALGRKKAERAFAAAVLPYRREQSERPVAELMGWLQQVGRLRDEWAYAHQALTTLPGVQLSPTWSLLDPTALQQVRAQAEPLPQIAAATRSPWGRLVTDDPVLRANAATIADACAAAGQAWQQLLTMLGVDAESAHRWTAGRSMWDAWTANAVAWSDDTPRFIALQRWCDVLRALQPLRSAGLDHIASELLGGRAPLTDAEARFRRGVAQRTLQEQLTAGRLDRFDGRSHARVLEDYGTHHGERTALTTQRIPFDMVDRRPVPKGRRIGKWGELERSLAAQRRKLSIRDLMQAYGRFVGDLTPCFLMSPDSVARFIPPDSIQFDLVVFDEASQIEVPRAIGALGRAKAAIIVGDTRQMPPSQFGNPASVDEQDGSLDTVVDLESLLDECKESRLPTLTLQCHYRSRNEALIAFSNHHFYDDQLTTFPAPTTPGETAISWRRVDGRFRRTGMQLPDGVTSDDWPTGTNPIEAEAVVSEIVRRIAEFDRIAAVDPDEVPGRVGPSIGVVTSNIQQRDLIRDLLERSGNDRVRELLEMTTADGLLVQNLENVQGDERDVVMMSIGFSPQPTRSSAGTAGRGRLPMNFGPLNQKGGERRLNVAVTRAREEVLVFCSFEPEEMTVSPDSPAGIRLLQAYLAAARDGVDRAGDIVGRTPMPPDRHRTEIAQALRDRGWDVIEDVGLSKFRVDLCVGSCAADRSSDRIPAHSLAIMLDGPRWAAGSTIFDRDLLPSSVLTSMGWEQILRIWMPNWLYDHDEVIGQVEAAVRQAESAAIERLDRIPPPLPPVLDVPIPVSLENLEPVAAPARPLPTPPEPVLVQASQPAAPDVPPEPLGAALDVFGEVATYGAGVELSGAGTKDALDRLDDPAIAGQVRAVLVRLAEQLGPIEIDELCRCVARSYGLSRVRADRVAAIHALLPRTLPTTTSKIGRFVWPEGVDPTTWRGFRRNDGEMARKLTEMAPEEVLNAMRTYLQAGTAVGRSELLDVVSKLFGHERMTAPVRDRLDTVLGIGLRSGAIVDLGDDTFGPGNIT